MPGQAPPALRAPGAPVGPALRAPGAPVGLYNEGATCYLNALLQLLFMLPVREAILKWRPDESDDASGDDASGDDASPPAAPSADLKITGELQRLFARLVLGDARAASTRDLVAAFGWSGAEALEQQDVSECLNVLCDRGFHGSARAALDELCGGTTVTVLERRDGTRPPRSGEPAPPGVRDGGERAAKRGGHARPASRSAGGIGARPQVKFLELHLGLDRPTVEAALAAYFAGDDPRGFPPDFDASVGTTHAGHYEAEVKDLATGAWWTFNDDACGAVDADGSRRADGTSAYVLGVPRALKDEILVENAVLRDAAAAAAASRATLAVDVRLFPGADVAVGVARDIRQ
ncbi:thiol-dependent ubiquitin-specific protease [Aureococcus anophagefferens]|nr:thiol-dependent ubiquitin-specific protease [Aureococcus anophagefferens]